MKYLKIYESFSKRSVEDYLKENNIKNDVTELYCYNNQIESLNGIENLTNLTTLDCYNNQIESLKGIENLTNLTELFCSYNKIESLKGIENLINLKELDCSHNKLKNLDEIKNLTKLDDFTFHDNEWEYLLPNELINISPFLFINGNFIYTKKNIKYFKTYEFQRKFITKYPERVKELEIFGYNEKIKEEFADIIEGSEFGFFNLK